MYGYIFCHLDNLTIPVLFPKLFGALETTFDFHLLFSEADRFFTESLTKVIKEREKRSQMVKKATESLLIFLVGRGISADLYPQVNKLRNNILLNQKRNLFFPPRRPPSHIFSLPKISTSLYPTGVHLIPRN
jgi:hypothetical protein